MLPILLSAFALAAPPDTPITVVGALGGTAAAPSLGGFGSLHVLANFGRVSGEFIGREGAVSNDLRTVGGIHFDVRYTPETGPYVRGGFIHHHETPWDAMVADPFLSLIGSGASIRHRSGLELGLGLDLPVTEHVLDDRLGFVLDLSVAVFPDPQGPPVYVFLEQGWSVDVGRKGGE